MSFQGKIKRKVVTQQEDIILLNVCIHQLPCLQSLGNNSYKGQFWKNVSINFNKQTQSSRTVRQIRNRFKSMYEYYLKVRNSSSFLVNQQKTENITEEVVFFQTLAECFSQMYYDNKGILNHRVQKVDEVELENETATSSLEDILSIGTSDTHYDNNNISVVYEMNSNQHYGPTLDMFDIFYNNSVQNDNLEIDESLFKARLLLTPIQNLLTNTNYANTN